MITTDTYPEQLTILYNEAAVHARVIDMAPAVLALCKSTGATIVTIPEGAVPFTKMLLEEMDMLEQAMVPDESMRYKPDVQRLTISAYGVGHAPQEPKVTSDLPDDHHDLQRPVVLIEDLIDTGVTVRTAKHHLVNECHATNVTVVALVQKHKNNPPLEKADIVGFDDVDDNWLVGMGMNMGDNDLGLDPEEFRTAKWIGFMAMQGA